MGPFFVRPRRFCSSKLKSVCACIVPSPFITPLSRGMIVFTRETGLGRETIPLVEDSSITLKVLGAVSPGMHED